MWILSSCDGTVSLLEHVSDNVPTSCRNASSHPQRAASYSLLQATHIPKTLLINVRCEIWDCYDGDCEDLCAPVCCFLKYIKAAAGTIGDVDWGFAEKPPAETTWWCPALRCMNFMLQNSSWKSNVRNSQEVCAPKNAGFLRKTKLYYLTNRLHVSATIL